jgi:hypothetical protein
MKTSYMLWLVRTNRDRLMFGYLVFFRDCLVNTGEMRRGEPKASGRNAS